MACHDLQKQDIERFLRQNSVELMAALLTDDEKLQNDGYVPLRSESSNTQGEMKFPLAFHAALADMGILGGSDTQWAGKLLKRLIWADEWINYLVE